MSQLKTNLISTKTNLQHTITFALGKQRKILKDGSLYTCD